MTELVREARRAKQASQRAKKALEARDALIVQLHREGESPKLLAEAAGLSENQVFKIVRAGRGKGGKDG